MTSESLFASEFVPTQQRSGDKNVETKVAHGDGVAGARVPNGDVLVGDRGVEVGLDRGRLGTARFEHEPHRDAAEHGRQPDDVVGVRVGRDHDVQALDAERRELRRDLLLVRAAVDQDRRRRPAT